MPVISLRNLSKEFSSSFGLGNQGNGVDRDRLMTLHDLSHIRRERKYSGCCMNPVESSRCAEESKFDRCGVVGR